jgi:hypothetical protein
MKESHSIFQNIAYYEQAPAELQLAATLGYLGHNENGACVSHMIPT